MCQDHPATAVPLESELVHGLSFRVVRLEESEIGLPLLANDLAAAVLPFRELPFQCKLKGPRPPEATDWNNHFLNFFFSLTGASCEFANRRFFETLRIHSFIQYIR